MTTRQGTARPTAGGSLAKGSIARSSALLAVALMANNLANYLIAVAGSHRLSQSRYGELASLLAVLLVAAIPALALQAVIARRTAHSGLTLYPALAAGALCGGLSAAAGGFTAPALQGFLHLHDHGLALTLAAAGLLPLNVVTAIWGHLQGREKFGGLAIVVTVFGLGRALGGLLPLLLGTGPAAVMAGISLGTLAAAGVSLWLVVGGSPAGWPRLSGYRHHPTGIKAVRLELVAAILSMGALLLLSNLDLLLGRHVLSSTVSGRYAAGNIVAKAAFWLPQAVPLAALPRLSNAAERDRALRESGIVTAVIGAASITVTALAGGFLTSLTFGASYRSVGHVAWLFAAQGSALAGVQLLIIDDIARQRRGIAPLVVIAAAAETVIVFAAGISGLRSLATVAAATGVALLVGCVVRRREPLRSQWPASSQVGPKPHETSSDTSRV